MRERISSTKKLKTESSRNENQTGGAEVEKIKNRTERGIESVMPNAPDTQNEFIKALLDLRSRICSKDMQRIIENYFQEMTRNGDKTK